MEKALVSVLMGSDSDLDIMKSTFQVLKDFGVPFDAKVLSAHRTPNQLVSYIEEMDAKGVMVYIAAAGGAAHLAGVVGAHTINPVLAVPINATNLAGGLDALLAMVQMPPGIPVGTLAVGSFGAYNAAVLAVQCIALAKPEYAVKLKKFKVDMVDKIESKNQKLQKAILELK